MRSWRHLLTFQFQPLQQLQLAVQVPQLAAAVVDAVAARSPPRAAPAAEKAPCQHRHPARALEADAAMPLAKRVLTAAAMPLASRLLTGAALHQQLHPLPRAVALPRPRLRLRAAALTRLRVPLPLTAAAVQSRPGRRQATAAPLLLLRRQLLAVQPLAAAHLSAAQPSASHHHCRLCLCLYP